MIKFKLMRINRKLGDLTVCFWVKVVNVQYLVFLTSSFSLFYISRWLFFILLGNIIIND